MKGHHPADGIPGQVLGYRRRGAITSLGDPHHSGPRDIGIYMYMYICNSRHRDPTVARGKDWSRFLQRREARPDCGS
jgi:hypothetical protein